MLRLGVHFLHFFFDPLRELTLGRERDVPSNIWPLGDELCDDILTCFANLCFYFCSGGRQTHNEKDALLREQHHEAVGGMDTEKTTYEGEPSPTVDNRLNWAMCDEMTPTLERVLDGEVVKEDVLEGIYRKYQTLLVCEARVP